MIKKYANTALIYAIIAMVCGVFYREFTKYSLFTGKTNLSVMHAHYFTLGVIFFLILMLLEKNFAFSDQKNISTILVVYHIGLNMTGAMFFVRGLTQVLMTELSSALDASISGIAGIGHILLGVGMVLILLKLKKKAA